MNRSRLSSQPGKGGEEALRVGVLRMGEELVRGALLYDASLLHDHDAVCEELDD